MKAIMESPGRPRACGYVRVSGRKEAVEGNSLSDQREAILRHCVLEGLDLVEVFSDGGISGGRDETGRPGLRSALAAIREGRAAMLVVKHIDRLSRDSDLAGFLKVELKRLGGRLIVIDEAKNDPVRLIVDKMLAELERLRGSERMRFVHASKKQRGMWTGMVPYGFKMDENKRLVPSDDEAHVVSKILELRAQGQTLRNIADFLNDQKVPTRRPGHHWSPQSVLNVVNHHQKDGRS